jgi:glycosyltransferase involved in cell wall biosynthesis
MTTSFIKRSPLRIALNAQLHPDIGSGGTVDATAGLIGALGQLHDGDEEYIIIAPYDAVDWWAQYIGPNQKVIPAPKRFREIQIKRLGVFEPIASKLRILIRQMSGLAFVPISDGFYESLGVDVIHFPYQHFTVCALPSLFSPYDLQHLHYPQYFKPKTILERETVYRAGCQIATTIIVASDWVKQDLIRQYGISSAKIQVIPMPAPTSFIPAPTPQLLEEVQQKYALPPSFAFYPAVTWPHKNHLRLLEAIALLRQQGLVVNLVCTGFQNQFWPNIRQQMEELNLGKQVHFLGALPKTELRAVYALATYVVYPTLFEGAGLPPMEAWHHHKPLAASRITGLPEMIGDAGLLFDPYLVESIADALRQMETDLNLRQQLQQLGVERLKLFTWEKTARAHRALYRRAGRRSLTELDLEALR